ncbi:Transthyretin-like family protein [Ancylostoma caninum]|uniref:Transthyretin-like family protein n=1 Tax=Ancylostoma caninum TaxID=29170 RepID=A0A368GR45_ANCCA|nr:Transthyretin-like family protein [Ancylostoma caninum]
MYRVVFIIALLLVCKAFRDQSVAVKGRFLCGKAPAAKVMVTLIDAYPDKQMKQNAILSKGYTDARGNFMFSGAVAKISALGPALKVYHDCNDVTKFGVAKPGSREVTFVIPDHYIGAGKTPKKIMDVGSINLELKFKNEERELK